MANAGEISVVELDGKRYVILPEARYERLLAGLPVPDDASEGWAAWERDAEGLGARLVERRKQAGLSQAALARKADLRVETLNRIERGHSVPDFATVRKLVLALRGAPRETRARQPRTKERR